ncbi:hypothetical protein PR048_014765 [Dryococelus australis]|uniref:Uncharacterized protein n=1 Tax=Dryococelus australis TaxID=614101 RepID=A0ABQ9HF30_9NEOP|nr:hypothetical protein PR048_014765 [Dryococelus australis]
MHILATCTGSPLSARRTDENDNQFLISQAVWLRVQKETPGELLLKISFNEDSFKVVDHSRNSRKNLQLPDELPPCRTKPLKTSKFKDIMTNSKDPGTFQRIT